MATKIDYFGQLVLLSFVGVCIASVYGIMAGLLMAVPLGAWQVISALVRYGEWKQLTKKEKNKLVIYQLITLGYFIAGAIEIESQWFDKHGLFAMFVVVPAALAIFYFVFTRGRYLKVKAEQ